MNISSLLRGTFAAAIASFAITANAQNEPSILENYTFGVGQNADGVGTALRDKYFGGGDAHANLAFFDTTRRQNPEDQTGILILHVARRVPAGTISFALLCFGIEVRGFDTEGTEIYAKDLPGFTFGDSQSGRFTRALRQIPLRVARLEVTFLGNYE
jgi:hypothetical protein